METFLTLQLFGNVDASYMQGWTQSVVVSGAVVSGWNFDGLTIPSDAGVVPIIPAFFHIYYHAQNPDDPAERGFAGSLVNPAYHRAYSFYPLEKTPVVRLLLEVRIPSDGSDQVVELRYQDGLVGSGQPITNAVSDHGGTASPEFVNESFVVTSRQVAFARGDTNEDGRRDISDAVVVLNFLFRGTIETECADAFDTNDDGVLGLSDAVSLFSFLFRGGPPPAPPFGECAQDTTEDPHRCWAHAGCD